MPIKPTPTIPIRIIDISPCASSGCGIPPFARFARFAPLFPTSWRISWRRTGVGAAGFWGRFQSVHLRRNRGEAIGRAESPRASDAGVRSQSSHVSGKPWSGVRSVNSDFPSKPLQESFRSSVNARSGEMSFTRSGEKCSSVPTPPSIAGSPPPAAPSAQPVTPFGVSGAPAQSESNSSTVRRIGNVALTCGVNRADRKSAQDDLNVSTSPVGMDGTLLVFSVPFAGRAGRQGPR